MNRTLRTLVVYGLSIIMLAILAQWWFDQVQGPEVVELSQFLDRVEGGDYETVEMLTRSNELQGRLTGSTLPADGWDQVSSYPEGSEGDVVALLRESGTPFSADAQPPGFWEVLVSFLPWLFLLGFMVFIFMQMQTILMKDKTIVAYRGLNT